MQKKPHRPRVSYSCPGAARPPRALPRMRSIPGARVSRGRQRGRRAGTGTARCGQQGGFAARGDSGFVGLGRFFVWRLGAFWFFGRLLIANKFPAWQAGLDGRLSEQLPCAPHCPPLVMPLTCGNGPLLSHTACVLSPFPLLPRKTASPAWARHCLGFGSSRSPHCFSSRRRCRHSC